MSPEREYKLCTQGNLEGLLADDHDAWTHFEGELKAYLHASAVSFTESIRKPGVDGAFDSEGEIQNVFVKLLQNDRRFLKFVASLEPAACRKYMRVIFRNLCRSLHRSGKRMPTERLAEDRELEDREEQLREEPSKGLLLMERRMELIRKCIPRETEDVGYLACALLYERLLVAQQHFRLDRKRLAAGRRLTETIERFVPFEEGDEALAFGKDAAIPLGKAWDACAIPIEQGKLPSNGMVASLLGVSDGKWYQWTRRARKFVIDALGDDRDSLGLFRNWPGFEKWGKP